MVEGQGDQPYLFDITPQKRDEMIEFLVQKIVKAGMGTPAIMFLSGYKPLGRLGGNALHVFSPFIGVFIPNIDAYGYLLQDPVNLEILIDRLEEIEEERGCQQKALRNERRARAKDRKQRAQAALPPGAGTAGDAMPPGAPQEETTPGSAENGHDPKA